MAVPELEVVSVAGEEQSGGVTGLLLGVVSLVGRVSFLLGNSGAGNSGTHKAVSMRGGVVGGCFLCWRQRIASLLWVPLELVALVQGRFFWWVIWVQCYVCGRGCPC